MSCPDCGKRVPILFNALEERRGLECLEKARTRTAKEQRKARDLNSASGGGMSADYYCLIVMVVEIIRSRKEKQ